MRTRIILASGSAIRADILRNAGISFDVIKPGVDEDVIKERAAAESLDLEATAMALAEAKCMAVAKGTDDIVIASDQILEFNDRPLTNQIDGRSLRPNTRDGWTITFFDKCNRCCSRRQNQLAPY